MMIPLPKSELCIKLTFFYLALTFVLIHANKHGISSNGSVPKKGATPTVSSVPISEVSRKLSKNQQKVYLHKPKGQAVILSDIIFDDTTAINHIARAGHYDKMHIVGTGISLHDNAHGHLKDFVNQQGLDKGKTKIQFYHGGRNVLCQKPNECHEQYFQGKPEKVHLTADRHLAKNLGKGGKVDVFHIAPAHERHIHSLADNKNIRLQTVHHVAGYNSDIQPTPNKASEFEHWSNLNKRIKKTHPKADLLITSTPQTFQDQGGATQEYHKLKGSYPHNHLEGAKKNLFFQKQFEKAEEYVQPHRDAPNGKGKSIPHLHPGKHDKQYANKPLDNLLIQARFDEHGLPKEKQKLRNHFNKYLDHAVPIVEKEAKQKDPKLAFRLEAGGVREAFSKPPMLEVCDGAHVACVLDVRKRKDKSSIVPATFHRDVENEGENAFLRLRKSQPGDPHHGHLVINQTGGKVRKVLIGNAKKRLRNSKKEDKDALCE